MRALVGAGARKLGRGMDRNSQHSAIQDDATQWAVNEASGLPAEEAPACEAGGRWYAVHTQPNREFRAKHQLENQAFEVFLPKRLKTVRHARKLRNITAAFFPRYLFIRLDLTKQRWRSVNGTFGVLRLVMQGELPHPVPSGVVETMLSCIDSNGLLCLAENLRIGSQIRVAAGPFAEKLGILDRLDDSGRVRVLLEILGGTVPVQLDRKYVTAA
jgi:transcription elongation factor/antiterminator RfaH